MRAGTALDSEAGLDDGSMPDLRLLERALSLQPVRLPVPTVFGERWRLSQGRQQSVVGRSEACAHKVHLRSSRRPHPRADGDASWPGGPLDELEPPSPPLHARSSPAMSLMYGNNKAGGATPQLDVGDSSSEQAFLKFHARLPALAAGAARLFERGSYYSAHGSSALLVAHEVYNTSTALKYLGRPTTEWDKGLPSVTLNGNAARAWLREALTVKQMRVEVSRPALVLVPSLPSSRR
jgi:hypothetical protein